MAKRRSKSRKKTNPFAVCAGVSKAAGKRERCIKSVKRRNRKR